jgi:hypothetical protein
MRQGWKPRPLVAFAVVIVLVAVMANPSPALVQHAEGSKTVVGFGDSVAAGYGLSLQAKYDPADVTQRYANDGSTCSATPKAYPCVLARDLGDQVSSSHNYAIQGATSAQVLALELPEALKMPPADRNNVNVVTLTVGADDIDFVQCLTDEFEAQVSPGSADPCLAGNINDLLLSPDRIASVQTLEYATLPLIFSKIEHDFINARIYVTDYYQPFPSPPQPGQDACRLFLIPALAALVGNLGGLSSSAAALAVLAYIRELPDTDALFQTRFYRVSTFLVGQLNATIDGAVTAAGVPVASVSLDSFASHDMCANNGKDSWVYTLSTTGSIKLPLPAGKIAEVDADTSLGPKCYHADLTAEKSRSISLLGFGTATVKPNCIPHPTETGQAQIADAIRSAAAPTPPAAASCPVDSLPRDVMASTELSGQSPGDYTVSNIRTASSDMSWAYFEVVATAAAVDTFQNARGVAHCVNGAWNVLEVGSTDIGCTAAPANIRAELGLQTDAQCAATEGAPTS